MKWYFSGKSCLTWIPNILSVTRLFLVLPLFQLMRESRVFLSSMFLIFIVLTDILDGYFARKFHLENPVGRILDHGVDKIVSICMCYIFLKFSLLPAWAFWFFFIRDLFILILGGVLYFAFKLAFGSLWIGKIAGIFYFGMFFSFLLKFESLGNLFMYISVFLFSIVLVVYPLKFYPVLKTKIFRNKGGYE